MDFQYKSNQDTPGKGHRRPYSFSRFPTTLRVLCILDIRDLLFGFLRFSRFLTNKQKVKNHFTLTSSIRNVLIKAPQKSKLRRGKFMHLQSRHQMAHCRSLVALLLGLPGLVQPTSTCPDQVWTLKKLVIWVSGLEMFLGCKNMYSKITAKCAPWSRAASQLKMAPHLSYEPLQTARIVFATSASLLLLLLLLLPRSLLLLLLLLLLQISLLLKKRWRAVVLVE